VEEMSRAEWAQKSDSIRRDTMSDSIETTETEGEYTDENQTSVDNKENFTEAREQYLFNDEDFLDDDMETDDSNENN